jgi:hypothetical protein
VVLGDIPYQVDIQPMHTQMGNHVPGLNAKRTTLVHEVWALERRTPPQLGTSTVDQHCGREMITLLPFKRGSFPSDLSTSRCKIGKDDVSKYCGRTIRIVRQHARLVSVIGRAFAPTGATGRCFGVCSVFALGCHFICHRFYTKRVRRGR